MGKNFVLDHRKKVLNRLCDFLAPRICCFYLEPNEVIAMAPAALQDCASVAMWWDGTKVGFWGTSGIPEKDTIEKKVAVNVPRLEYLINKQQDAIAQATFEQLKEKWQLRLLDCAKDFAARVATSTATTANMRDQMLRAYDPVTQEELCAAIDALRYELRE